MTTIHQRHRQTDGRTARWTTCLGNTALRFASRGKNLINHNHFHVGRQKFGELWSTNKTRKPSWRKGYARQQCVYEGPYGRKLSSDENPTLEPNVTSIGEPVVKLWPFLCIQHGRQPPSWILSNSKIAPFYLAPFSRYLRIKLENRLFSPPLYYLTPPLEGDPVGISGWNLSCKN